MSIAGAPPIQVERPLSPGPGEYNPSMPDFKPDYLHTQSNFVFKNGMKDRFGDFVDKQHEKKPLPGP